MKETQYNALLNKYNILVARCRDLEEQNETNLKHWKAEEEKFKKVEDQARKICEAILAKDRHEMVLGVNSSWYSTPVVDLLIRALKSYKAYNQETTKIMNDIQATSETRRAKIESLQDQIQQFLSGNSDYLPANDEESLSGNDDSISQPPDLSEAPAQYRAAAEAGKIELIIEEPGDVEVEGDMQPISELIEIGEQTKILPNAVPIKDSTKKARLIEQKKEESILAHVMDLNELKKRFNDTMWKILEVIGSEGLAKYPDIERFIMEKSPEIVKNKLRTATQQLYRMKVLDQESLNLPLTPRVLIYYLTDIGERLYRTRFEKAPVESERDKVRREHDNIEHGYGIMDLEKVLSESGRYKEIHIFNRRRAIPLPNHRQYIPDIICIPKQGSYTEYIEYERGTHTQADFEVKCSKMCKVTRYLNFVAPNRTVLLKRLRPQIEAWIASRGVESLRNIRIRLSTPAELRTANINEAWLVVYDLNKGAAAIKDNTQKEGGIS